MSNTSPEKKCDLCKAPFLHHEHQHTTRNGTFHSSCYKKVTGNKVTKVISSPTGWEKNIYKLIEFNPSMSKKEKDALIYLLVDKLIPELLAQERTQAKREVIEAILKKKKSLVHEYHLDDGWTHEIEDKMEVVSVEDIQQELEANTH